MSRLVVVSNRVPAPSAGAQAGGLAVALAGLLLQDGGLWFGWSGQISETAGTAAPVVTRLGTTEYATIDLCAAEHERYYNRFSNAVLWPILHTMPELVGFDRGDADAYRAVNARFADQLIPLLQPDDIIWVHDYHLMALPALLRARGVRNPIGFFLHIPFAAPDVLATVPEAAALVQDLLAADLVGFQTQNDLDNFKAAAARASDLVLPGTDCLWSGSRRVRLGVFPVEIDARAFAKTAARTYSAPRAVRLRGSLGDQALILGVDRLDPTKGLVQRLRAMRRLLEKQPQWQGHATLVQIAALSRKDVASYRSLRKKLEREAGRLNADWGSPDWQPLRLVAQADARDVVAGYMRSARVGLVTPLRDGMNLVAKEFVAAQDPDDPGVLVLSRYAGAARQLDAALLVSPQDPDDMADAIARALTMPLEERRARWSALWEAIESRSSLEWGRSFTAALLRSAPGNSQIRRTFAEEWLGLSELRTMQPFPASNSAPLQGVTAH